MEGYGWEDEKVKEGAAKKGGSSGFLTNRRERKEERGRRGKYM